MCTQRCAAGVALCSRHTTLRIASGRHNPRPEPDRPPPLITSHCSVRRSWPNDDDWPSWDPHTPVFPGAKSAAQLQRDFLKGRTIVFVGDSVRGRRRVLTRSLLSVEPIPSQASAHPLCPSFDKKRRPVQSEGIVSMMSLPSCKFQVNSLIFTAFECEVAKEGYMPVVRLSTA